ncbi:MAG: 16S rRNA processing protein RimM [Aeriscardovia sp.]|nr:16S rRNA processing protein RimM [Aeriscardovia sp.]
MDLVRVGKIVKPHGVRGEVSFFLTTDDPEGRLKKGASLVDGDGNKYRVRAARQAGTQTLLSLSGVDCRQKAEALRGKDLFAEAGKSDENGIYYKDLPGLKVELEGGEEVGTVSGVLETPQLLLEVDRSGSKCLIPWVKEFVKQVDLEGGRIIMSLPDGLLSACSY